MTEKKIRLGVVGAKRGMDFARIAPDVGAEVVALCETNEKTLANAAKRLEGVTTYTDFDKFIEHEMDGVVLANFFHQHVPLALKALAAGIHVMSETSACKTLGEGVALARAVEKSKKIYLFAENYPYFRYNQEMRRLYQQGAIGEIQYGEGEYVHPGPIEWRLSISPGFNHWRNHNPATYYCTHAMGPLMFITGLRPVSVNALCIPRPLNAGLGVGRGDVASVILCRMSNESVVRLIGVGLRGHGNWYRIHGTRGLMENLRVGNQDMLRVRHEPWEMREGEVEEQIYLPNFPEGTEEFARKAGHGGGDYFTMREFAKAIRTGETPYLDVYKGIDMSIVGIQGYRSALANGAPVEIPDFRNEEVRKKYENDDWSPFPEDRRPGQPWPSIRGEVKLTPEAIEYARKIWGIGPDDPGGQP
ncbi:MAG: Gfo/Idh/MocA family oxidoreductase [Firmicutes bacterium]|nr:Gfo/Idh/MocA family oxidoreductase [Bacillota bacterium]